jgi:hypothetical protein
MPIYRNTFRSDIFRVRLENLSVFGKYQCSETACWFEIEDICIELETLEKQCWSYLRNIKTVINYFLPNISLIIYPYFSYEKSGWTLGLPNTGIFYSKDVASALKTKWNLYEDGAVSNLLILSCYIMLHSQNTATVHFRLRQKSNKFFLFA